MPGKRDAGLCGCSLRPSQIRSRGRLCGAPPTPPPAETVAARPCGAVQAGREERGERKTCGGAGWAGPGDTKSWRASRQAAPVSGRSREAPLGARSIPPAAAGRGEGVRGAVEAGPSRWLQPEMLSVIKWPQTGGEKGQLRGIQESKNR